MKQITKILTRTLFILSLFLLLNNCYKNELKRVTTIATGSITEITSTTATATSGFGDVSSDVSEYGHCYNTSGNPETSDNKSVVNGAAKKGNYTTDLSSLAANTLHYIRAYVIDGGKTIYGTELTFTTLALVPTVVTVDATLVTGNSATLNGTINANNNDVTISFEWGETTAYGNTVAASPSNVSGNTNTAVSADITSLTDGTTYHFRVKAVNTDGTTNGADMSFTTSGNPTVTTEVITSITDNSAVSGGNVTDDGGSSVTAKGICWSTSQNPTIADSNTNDGTGTGSFVSNLTGLAGNTTYYVRAYATNSLGTAYGNQLNFTTDEELVITVTSPTNQSHWVGEESRLITWTDNITGNVNIELFKGGSIEASIASDVTGNSYDWTIPNTLTEGIDYTIKVSSVDNGSIFDFSEDFEIVMPLEDIDGNKYKLIKIGVQWWMAENLKTTRYSNSDPLLDGTGVGDISGNYTAKYYFAYNDVAGNVDTYGRLYTWAAAMDGATGSDTNPSNRQGVCPTNWHIPSDAEWKEMEMHLGMSPTDANADGLRGTDQGGQLKEAGTTHWNSPNSDLNNSSGFTALPGGYRNDNPGNFSGLNTLGHFWTSAAAAGNDSWYRELSFNTDQIIRDKWLKNFGRSVRCVKN